MPVAAVHQEAERGEFHQASPMPDPRCLPKGPRARHRGPLRPYRWDQGEDTRLSMSSSRGHTCG